MKINHSDYTILVVDDVMTNVLLLQVLLDKEGFNVVTANDGQAAIEIIRKDVPDLILLDINMPNMDGFEVIREVKKYSLYREIPVIFLTAMNDVDSIVKGFRLGGSDYITKPFNKEELMARIVHQLSLLAAKRIIVKRTHVLKKTILDRDKMYSVIACLLYTSHELPHLFLIFNPYIKRCIFGTLKSCSHTPYISIILSNISEIEKKEKR